jgi:hypothetical protein
MKRNPKQRTIQDVLRLHVASAQGMYDTYKRIGNMDLCRYEQGFIDGLELAIEIANNRALRERPPAHETGAEE